MISASSPVLAPLALLALARSAFAHVGFWHPSMYGWNVTQQTFGSWDNRPVTPLMGYTFEQWWWHSHQNYPPNDGDVFEWPAGGTADVQTACNKGYTTWWAQSEGTTDVSIPEGLACGYGGPNTVHASSINDVMGCGIAIVDKQNIADIQPEDFAIFTVKHQCPWYTHNTFSVPDDMPACTGDYCHCAWFWIHAPDSGGEQMFMNAFRCKVTGVKSTAKKIGTPKVARRCGADPANNKPADPSNCTVGAKQPLYWYQLERNNMFEGTYSPPFYNDLYDFQDGAQVDIFVDEAGNQVSSSGGNTNNNAQVKSGSSSTSSAAPAGNTGSSGSGSGSGNGGSSNTNAKSDAVSAPATGSKSQVCKRRTPDAKRKRDLRRAAKAAKGHNKKRSFADLFT